MSNRPCSEWFNGCAISASPLEVGVLCRRWVICLYAADQEDLAPGEWELLDAWLRMRLCLWPPVEAPLRDGRVPYGIPG
jgi:hypothetical protein